MERFIRKQASAASRIEAEEILGQGLFRYQADRTWGRLDPHRQPVKDCHGIAENSDGDIVLLTNHVANNFIVYEKSGAFRRAWETRFPGAHGLAITQHDGEDRYWVTDHNRKEVVVLSADGKDILSVGSDAVADLYRCDRKYLPTNAAVAPDGDFFVGDGYGSSFIHHFDSSGTLIASFGGEGDGPENLKQPHGIAIDGRGDAPALLVCDRGNNLLKWFSFEGDLLKTIAVPGAMPSNVAPFKGRYQGYLAVACLTGMILILDDTDAIISVVGGQPPRYDGDRMRTLYPFNYEFNHPHDVCVDEDGALYVAQWWSNRTYPIKLELVSE
ncbi:MAG: 6-bladed beta-propeller [Pseudomonadota bacterium]